jgi:adenylate cyclase
LTTALAPAIADAELRRAIHKPPESLDAWAAYQRGLWHLSKANPNDDTIAQNFFRQAIDLDPTFAPGYSALALAQLQAAAVYQKLSLAEAQSLAEALARRAVSLDGGNCALASTMRF